MPAHFHLEGATVKKFTNVEGDYTDHRKITKHFDSSIHTSTSYVVNQVSNSRTSKSMDSFGTTSHGERVIPPRFNSDPTAGSPPPPPLARLAIEHPPTRGGSSETYSRFFREKPINTIPGEIEKEAERQPKEVPRSTPQNMGKPQKKGTNTNLNPDDFSDRNPFKIHVFGCTTRN